MPCHHRQDQPQNSSFLLLVGASADAKYVPEESRLLRLCGRAGRQHRNGVTGLICTLRKLGSLQIMRPNVE